MKNNIPMQRKNITIIPHSRKKVSISRNITVIILIRGPKVFVYSNIKIVFVHTKNATNAKW